ncbi:helix-hairpin-helix domain-containing protein [Marinicella sp. S1101]|uniref:ComEA family DNA-binding protein n=1 Tax=Marinicella marina TaxID=2996016 RepID=UPI002260D1C9|nr:helix-hairpin-helix domain-containing protein [Marinicella marina]MCX7553939.1 helix-hairpin-helix domain-containing protein [Marinicella marina]
MKYFKIVLIAVFLFAQSALAAVNVNKADAAQIAEELKGIGLSKATAIVAYRTQNGPFKTVEQLTEVKGIGLKTVEKNRSEILLK